MEGWNYEKGASFFITIATAPRRALFGRMAGGKMMLSPLGMEVAASLERMPGLSPAISLFGHVVMPDHIHFNCHLAAGLEAPLKTLGAAIRSFKNHTTKVYKAMLANSVREPALHFPSPASAGACDSSPASAGALDSPPASAGARDSSPASAGARDSSPASAGACDSSPASAGVLDSSPASAGARTMFAHTLWQRGYHDHLCLSRRFIDATERYIAYNPLKWQLMHGPGAVRVVEPVFSPRLDPGDYWKAAGNLALIALEAPLVSLRVSRKVVDFAPVLARMRTAAERGYAIASGFISKGEQAVRDMLCHLPQGRLVRVRPSAIPNARFRPESIYVRAMSEGRYLELGKGNEDFDFSRSACLDVNREIIGMAAAGRGLSLYFRKDGLYKLSGGGQWRKTR